MKINEIAAMVQGQVFGDGDLEIHGITGIDAAVPGEITYVTDKKAAKMLLASRATAAVVPEYIEDVKIPQVAVKNPKYAFAILLNAFHVKPRKHLGISEKAVVSAQAEIGANVTVYPTAYISDGARIGKGTTIFPGVFIGENTSIGEGCLIYPNVTIREGVRIGNNVIIHAGAVIGADGFGYVFANGGHYKVPQIGGVVIEDDVEIGANAAIDRGTTGDTVIGKGTKIDNLVQVAHNVTIGPHSILVAQVGIGGSTKIGAGVVLAGQAGIADHVEIEAGTMVGAQAGVTGKLTKGVYLGSPAKPFRETLKSAEIYQRLPELSKKLVELEKKLASLVPDKPGGA